MAKRKKPTEENATVPHIAGELESPVHRRNKTTARTLVFTCAQNNTKLHENFWKSLLRFCNHNNAELHISRLTYNKNGQSAGMAKPGSEKGSDSDNMWYDPRIEPYVSDEAVQVTPDLVWCGELNILPTRAYPLSTLKTYTRQASGIVPHVKIAMESIPGLKPHGPRFMYTTGTVTLRNYIQKIAGQVAEFHHVFGAVVVEVAEDGVSWWARQLNSDTDGVFYDLTTKYTPNAVVEDNAVDAIVHGDIHTGKADKEILAQVFGPYGVVNMLRPKHQFFHDLLDFTPRNHHNIKDPHFLWSWDAKKSVEEEFVHAVQILESAKRGYSDLHVVVSNHDTAINHWLKNTSGFYDPTNVAFWLAMNTYVHAELELNRDPHPFAHVLRRMQAPADVIKEDESFTLHGIEFGMHGHLGPNGARGAPRNLRVVGKSCTGHTHTAGIIEGVYTAGVYGKLDMGYNKGPSAWSHSFTIVYPNGKRTIVTFNKLGAWRGY